jgi:uncharacterized surface protein with fasciclin (FAS1) repeats
MHALSERTPTTRRLTGTALLLTSALLLGGCADGADAGSEAAAATAAASAPADPTGAASDQGPTVLDVATGEGATTFATAVRGAGLEQTLALPGPLTVFAPSDAAFEALPPGLLDALLAPENAEALTLIVAYHVVEDDLPAADLDGDVTALSGQKLTLSSTDGGSVNGVPVLTPDVEASNGTVHVIDTVLIPPDIDPEALLAGGEAAP